MFIRLKKVYDILRLNLHVIGGIKTSNQKQKYTLKERVELLEKEILNMTGTEGNKARLKYRELLQSYSKECGLEEPIYLTRA